MWLMDPVIQSDFDIFCAYLTDRYYCHAVYLKVPFKTTLVFKITIIGMTSTLNFRSLIDKIDQSEFDGFEYINPLLMSAEDVV